MNPWSPENEAFPGFQGSTFRWAMDAIFQGSHFPRDEKHQTNVYYPASSSRDLHWLIPMWFVFVFGGVFFGRWPGLSSNTFQPWDFTSQKIHHIWIHHKGEWSSRIFLQFPKKSTGFANHICQQIANTKVQFCLSTNWKRTAKSIGSYWFTASFPQDPQMLQFGICTHFGLGAIRSSDEHQQRRLVASMDATPALCRYLLKRVAVMQGVNLMYRYKIGPTKTVVKWGL